MARADAADAADAANARFERDYACTCAAKCNFFLTVASGISCAVAIVIMFLVSLATRPSDSVAFNVVAIVCAVSFFVCIGCGAVYVLCRCFCHRRTPDDERAELLEHAYPTDAPPM